MMYSRSWSFKSCGIYIFVILYCLFKNTETELRVELSDMASNVGHLSVLEPTTRTMIQWRQLLVEFLEVLPVTTIGFEVMRAGWASCSRFGPFVSQ